MALEVGSAVLGAVVPSLGKLLVYELFLDKAVEDGLTNLQAELNSMHAFLENVSSMRLDGGMKLWADEVRELSHAIETRLHYFVVSIESTKSALVPAINKKVINHQIDSYIREIMTKINMASERHARYSDSYSKSISVQKVDHRILAMYTREHNPVGITEAVDDLAKKLSKGHHVSIVGMGGMGKTTLAQAAHDKMKGDYDCEAFVSIGQRADPMKVLKDIFYGLRIKIYGNEPDQVQLTTQLQNFLVDKRYLIVIDDLWDEEIWTLIKNACVGKADSKIITTSRYHKIPVVADGAVYEIKPLSSAHSKELLHRKIFGAKAESHDTEFDTVSDKILHKCGGVPIAITMMGSFLAKNKSKGWQRVYDSIGFDEHKKDGAFEHIKKLQCFSYYDLPSHLRRCFLYLSLFPEDHWIEKNMLIWRWVAEGLVPGINEPRENLFGIGETYLNELTERSMIQLATRPHITGQGGFRIHDIMVDLIRDLSSSKDKNFCTVLGRKWDSTSATSTIHRLAIHKASKDQNQNTSMEVGEVLSFYAGTCHASSLPPLSKFARLRVVDLEGCDLSAGDYDLKHLGKLAELEYIGLLGTHVAELPKKIGRLKFLQTLDIMATGIKELPPFVEKLTKLRCLRAGNGTRLMGRVGKLASLEELWLHSADKSPDFAAELRKLTELRVLVIHFDEVDVDMQKKLVESLCHLKKLQALQIWFETDGMALLDGWEDNEPYLELRQLVLFGAILSKETPWIHHSRAVNLSKLLLQVETLEAQHLEILGQMESLRYLYLDSKEVKYRLSYTASKNEYMVLEYLFTNIELICGKDELPMIQELEVTGVRVGTDVGLQGNMPLLERATYHVDCLGCRIMEVHKAEEELRQASQAHPSRPTLSIKRWNNFGLEMQHLVPEIVRVLKEPLDAGSNPGLGGGEVDSICRLLGSPALSNKIFESVSRLMPTLGADSTTSSSQKPSPGKIEFSTDQITAALNHQFTARLLSDAAGQTQMDPAVIKNMVKKCMQKPETISSLNNMLPNGDWSSASVSDISGIMQLMIPDMITHFEENKEVPNVTLPVLLQIFGGVAASTQEQSGKSFEDANCLLASFDSLIAILGLSVPDAALVRNVMEKCLLNPEFVTFMNSKAQNADGPFSASDYSRLAKLMMPEFLAEQMDGPGKGQGKHPAENSGAGVSCEPPPEVNTDSMLRWLNSPDGATFSSGEAARLGVGHVSYVRILEKCLGNPKMIASMSSAARSGDFSDMTSCFRNSSVMMELMIPDIIDYLQEPYIDKPSLTPQCADGGVQTDTASSSVAQGMGAAPSESAQDGEKVSTMRRQLLPAVKKELATRASSGQPSSAQVVVDSMPSEGGQADASGMLSGSSSDQALTAQSRMMDAVASSTSSVAQGTEDGENSSTIFNFNEQLAALEKASAADEISKQTSSAQVNSDSMLSHGEPANASDTFSGLSSDPALAAQSDMMDAVASSTGSVAQSRQDGEISSTTLNLNELLAALEKSAAAARSRGQPSTAQQDNVGDEKGNSA